MATLAGKVVLITGAAQRIGAVIAKTLHAAGATVVIHYRHSAQPAEALQQAFNAQRDNSCFLVKGDILDTQALPSLIEQTVALAGKLDVLVNNASTYYPTPLGQIVEQQFDDLIGTNLKAPLFLAQAALPQLRAHNGCIINIVDINGYRPIKDYSVYCIAKAGLILLTKSLALELPGIRVNGIAPGAILWPEMTENHVMHEDFLAKTPLKREGTPEDIANTVLFLIRDAPFVTGQVLAVDGGVSLVR